MTQPPSPQLAQALLSLLLVMLPSALGIFYYCWRKRQSRLRDEATLKRNMAEWSRRETIRQLERDLPAKLETFIDKLKETRNASASLRADWQLDGSIINAENMFALATDRVRVGNWLWARDNLDSAEIHLRAARLRLDELICRREIEERLAS